MLNSLKFSVEFAVSSRSRAAIMRNSVTPRQAQLGVALLTALFIVALSTIAAVAMVADGAVAIRRTANLQDSEQAQWYALGAEAWVCQLLAEAQQQNGGKPADYDSLGDTWAQPLTLPVDSGVISGYLEDLQGRFNLNNLMAQPPKPFYDQLSRLVENIPGVDPFSATELGPSVRDWIDPDSEQSEGGGAESNYYLALEVPYRAGNQLMKSPSELNAVKGMTADLRAALAPYVASLPVTNLKINLNTAPLPVLASLTTQPSSALQAFVKDRIEHPLTSVADAGKDDLFPGAQNLTQIADVKTSWFLLHATVKIGDGNLRLYSVIQRSGSAVTTTTQSPIVVVSHSYGTE